MTWGFSRDDVEAAFFPTYLDQGVFAVSPFESIDVDGVGALVATAVRLGRETRPDLHLGVCGEHGGDPDSIHFFEEARLDYVSCSPFRVPVARLEAARAVLGPGDRHNIGRGTGETMDRTPQPSPLWSSCSPYECWQLLEEADPASPGSCGPPDGPRRSCR